MREVLLDVLKRVQSVANDKDGVSVLKITANDTNTRVQGVDGERTVFFDGLTKEPIAGFKGEFGFSSLQLLKGLLEFPSYRTEEATLTATVKEWKGGESIETLEFRDANGFGADYRCTSPDHCPEQAEIKSIPFDIEIKPSPSALSEFVALSGLYKDAKTVNLYTEKGNLVLAFGDTNSASHQAKMVFANDVTGTIKKGELHLGLSRFLSFAKMAASDTSLLKISARGIVGVETETEFGSYHLYLRASPRAAS